MAADITRALLFQGPGRHGIVDFPCAFQAVHKGELCGLEFFDLVCELTVDFLEVGFEDPPISKCVAILKHFKEVIAAETFPVGEIADIALHVGGARAKCEVKQVLL